MAPGVQAAQIIYLVAHLGARLPVAVPPLVYERPPVLLFFSSSLLLSLWLWWTQIAGGTARQGLHPVCSKEGHPTRRWIAGKQRFIPTQHLATLEPQNRGFKAGPLV